ncbi:MAG: hypothetical protein IPP32_00615 [Bacteroidetes bacterium]|nr:hypothetical protein [Bacteroidota bacterium]
MITHATFFGVQIAEPTTAFTDFILAFLCILFYFQFSAAKQDKGALYWKLFFLFMGCSTFIGGITHAVFENHHTSGYLIFWITMQILSGLSVYAAQVATIYSIPNANIPIYRSEDKSLLICRIQFFVFALATLTLQNFLIVVVNSTVGFLMVLFIHAISGKKYGNRPAGWIALGITISFLTAIIYTLKISLNDWFNFKDIAHVIMMVSVCFIFYGVGLSIQGPEKEETFNSN